MRALICFDCFGVIFMTMFFTSSRFDDPLIYSLLFALNAVPAPESHRGVASLLSSQSHIPFGLLFSFQGTMKRSFTYSHWEVPNYRVFLKRFFYFAKDPFTYLELRG